MYGVMSDSNGLYYMRARFYSPEIRRFVNRDILLGGVIEGQTLNRFAFVTGQPISFVDPFGLYSFDIFVQDASNFSAGFGDTISFGLTNQIRDWMDINSGVNKCSLTYNVAEWIGIGYGFVAGGAAGWSTAGQKAVGKEFSHWIPNRIGGPRSKWNGNFVTARTHALSDPFRYRFMKRSWKPDNPIWPASVRQLVRLPYWITGAGIGGILMIVNRDNCDCQN